jgi:hypothetical protein
LFRESYLSNIHYASKWKVPNEEDFNNREEVNRLGIKYASIPPGQEREAILLQLIEYFNSYLQKYLQMIIKGHMPTSRSSAGKDSVIFLKTLVPRSIDRSTISRVVLSNVCKTLHLAFKQCTTDDIYDILVLCLIKAVDKYDPTYTDKIKKICQTIDTICPKRKSKSLSIEFTADDITTRIGFNSVSYIRLLVRKGFLVSITGPKKKVIGYKRGNWPPPKTFFESGPVGLTYFLQMYFRYYLHEYISTEMSTLESQEGIFQLDHRQADDSWKDFSFAGIPDADGDFIDTHGQAWSADVELINHPLDISEMTLEWVAETDDKLFRKLTPMERNILRMVWLQEYTWKDIGKVLGCDSQTSRKRYEEIMVYLQARAKGRKKDKTCSKIKDV